MSVTTSIRVDYQDEDIKQRVTTFLASRHFPAFRKLDVQVNDGAVKISGQLPTYYEKQVALSTCQRVAGVLVLVDDIDVSESDGEASRRVSK